MTYDVTDGVRMRWEAEAEDDARGLIAIRDTLTIIDPRDYPVYSKARRTAREVEGLKEAIEARFVRQADCCPKCMECETGVTFSDHWTIKCAFCGWTRQGDTWTEALDHWNGYGGASE